MNKDLVIVESKTINNESVPITINVVEVQHGEVVDKREISRSFIFEDFQSQIPLKLAKVLVKEHPDEYRIIGAVDKNPSVAVKSALKIAKETARGFICEFCQKEAGSKAGLTAHIRYNHPEEFAKLYGKKAKNSKEPKAKVEDKKEESKK